MQTKTLIPPLLFWDWYKYSMLVQGHEDLGSTKVVVQKELDRVPYWILLGTYTNIGWSVHLSPIIT